MFWLVRWPPVTFCSFNIKLNKNYFPQTKFSYSLRVVRPGRLYFAPVRDRLFLLQTCLSLGGGVWWSRVEHVCRVVYLWCTVCCCRCRLWRTVPYERCAYGVHTTGGKPAYIKSGARLHVAVSIMWTNGVNLYFVNIQPDILLWFIYLNKWPTRGLWNIVSYCVLPPVFPPHIQRTLYNVMTPNNPPGLSGTPKNPSWFKRTTRRQKNPWFRKRTLRVLWARLKNPHF